MIGILSHGKDKSGKTLIEVVDKQNRRSYYWITPTAVDEDSAAAFASLACLPEATHCELNTEKQCCKITLSKIEDLGELRTVVPSLLSHHRIDTEVKFSKREQFGKVWRATSRGAAATWRFLAPKIGAAFAWSAPRIVSGTIWLKDRVRQQLARKK